jgi:hypothetical protein
MRCPSCEFENPAGMKFCGQCATALTGPCPQCGFANPPGFALCGECATPLSTAPSMVAPSPQTYTPAPLAEKILTSKAALEGERKQVTVLFADLKGSMELLADRDPEEARAILDPVLERMMADAAWQALDPQQRRRQTLEAVKRLLIRESHVQPLLLIFEDLHWIDSETQALLDSLVASLPTARVLLLVNYCPEYQHGWGSKTYYTQLRLDPLPAASAEALLQVLLGDAPSLAPLNRLLIERTEGNPFFLEESIRTLVETGMLVGAPGAYRLAQPLDSLLMPATVQAVLAARIDRLPPEEKRLLQTTVVIGHQIPLPLLQAIAELPEADLDRGLAHLQAAEFLYETQVFPERTFTCKHALTYEVAYSRLLQERRRGLHARIGEALERLYADRLDEQVERLAHHAFRGDVWDKACTYYRQAWAKAMEQLAYPAVVVSYEQAQAVAALAVAYAWSGHLADTTSLLKDRPYRTDIVLCCSEASLLTGHVAEASQLAQRALAHPATIKSRATRHTPCGSLAKSLRIAIPQRSSRPKPITASPSPWPTNVACVRSRRIATWAWAPCMPRSADRSKPAASSRPPSTCTAPWR